VEIRERFSTKVFSKPKDVMNDFGYH